MKIFVAILLFIIAGVTFSFVSDLWCDEYCQEERAMSALENTLAEFRDDSTLNDLAHAMDELNRSMEEFLEVSGQGIDLVLDEIGRD